MEFFFSKGLAEFLSGFQFNKDYTHVLNNIGTIFMDSKILRGFVYEAMMAMGGIVYNIGNLAGELSQQVVKLYELCLPECSTRSVQPHSKK